MTAITILHPEIDTRPAGLTPAGSAWIRAYEAAVAAGLDDDRAQELAWRAAATAAEPAAN